MTKHHDVIVIGAGAAGLMCAIEAGKRGRRVLVLDHAEKPAEKIRISGGGRCNFTNIHASPANYLSQNPHFCKSALSRYTPADFVALVEKHNIWYHEKTLGQLFCDGSAMEIIAMLLAECAAVQAEVRLKTSIQAVEKTTDGFSLQTSAGLMTCASLVVASGGLSIPKMGATAFGYELAKQFGLAVIPPRAALVPLTFEPALLAETQPLAGLAVEDAEVSAACGQRFREGLLFTHRGLSGPSILQISSYWQPGEFISVNLHTAGGVLERLKEARKQQPKQQLQTVLSDILPRRLAVMIAAKTAAEVRMAEFSDVQLGEVANLVERWPVRPGGTEGFRTAEVTLGGVDTDALSSKTMECRAVPGLYFIGEVVDVTGHLGGFNFQWAWASGWCAGQAA